MNTENNKLIAEFMGYKFNAYPELKHNNITKPNGKDWYYASWEFDDFEKEINDTLNYNSNWNLLMPVVEKMESMKYGFEIIGNYCKVIGINIYCSQPTKIAAVYKAVVEFITWYNKQPKK